MYGNILEVPLRMTGVTCLYAYLNTMDDEVPIMKHMLKICLASEDIKAFIFYSVRGFHSPLSVLLEVFNPDLEDFNFDPYGTGAKDPEIQFFTQVKHHLGHSKTQKCIFKIPVTNGDFQGNDLEGVMGYEEEEVDETDGFMYILNIDENFRDKVRQAWGNELNNPDLNTDHNPLDLDELSQIDDKQMLEKCVEFGWHHRPGGQVEEVEERVRTTYPVEAKGRGKRDRDVSSDQDDDDTLHPKKRTRTRTLTRTRTRTQRGEEEQEEQEEQEEEEEEEEEDEED